jgi:uncharacterized protein YndB with AHSA1/START domain
MTSALTPLKKAITVPVSQAQAFRRFTSEISSWWPLKSHSVGQAMAERVVFEERRGGRIYEVIRGGKESVWGTVTAWNPHSRVAFTWHPDDTPDHSTEIELTFHPEGDQTRVELVHTGWERLGAQARKARRGYPIGWAYVLRLYAGRKHSPLVMILNAITWVLMRVGARRVPDPSASLT